MLNKTHGDSDRVDLKVGSKATIDLSTVKKEFKDNLCVGDNVEEFYNLLVSINEVLRDVDSKVTTLEQTISGSNWKGDSFEHTTMVVEIITQYMSALVASGASIEESLKGLVGYVNEYDNYSTVKRLKEL